MLGSSEDRAGLREGAGEGPGLVEGGGIPGVGLTDVELREGWLVPRLRGLAGKVRV